MVKPYNCARASSRWPGRSERSARPRPTHRRKHRGRSRGGRRSTSRVLGCALSRAEGRRATLTLTEQERLTGRDNSSSRRGPASIRRHAPAASQFRFMRALTGKGVWTSRVSPISFQVVSLLYTGRARTLCPTRGRPSPRPLSLDENETHDVGQALRDPEPCHRAHRFCRRCHLPGVRPTPAALHPGVASPASL